MRASIVGEGSPTGAPSALWVVYLCAYVALTLGAATLVFRRKEF